MVYFRFYRRIPIIPGLVRLNIGKTGVSLSVGKRGWSITFGKYGIRFTKGIPGTGMWFSKNVNYPQKKEMPEKESTPTDINQFLGE